MAEPPLPTFLIIGAAKAGTSSLAAYLAAHPEVFVAPEKEVHFFDRYHGRGLDWYRSRFARAGDARAIGEATPTYLSVDRAIARMAETLPGAKLIAVLRNPVDRAYSQYWWMRATFERRPFEEAVRAEIQGSRAQLGYDYVSGGLYLERLQRVCAFYPRSALHVVILEEMRARPAEVFAGVCRFLGVGEIPPPEIVGRVVNPAYRLRWPKLREFMMRARAWRRLPLGLADRIDRWNRVPFTYPPMDPAIRAELERYFAGPNAALADWLGRDLAEWAPARTP